MLVKRLVEAMQDLPVGWPDGGMLVLLGKPEVVVGRLVPVLPVIWERPDVKGGGQVQLVWWELETVIGVVMVERLGAELMGGEPVSPGVFPVMLHDPGDKPPLWSILFSVTPN